jgi:CubicO group peptidase (beta-lactamase class C family)
MTETAVPGAAVGVLIDGTAYTKGFGITNVDNPSPVTEDTLFQVGSITKTMTGTILVRLAGQGKVDLDAPVRQYVPEFRVQDDDASKKARVRDLLTHMGGWVGDYFNSTGEGDDALDRMIAEMANLEQLAPIGTVWSYNNSGFYVAGKVIESVTGKRYEDVLRDMIFEDLGLADTYIAPADVMTKPFVVGHRVSEEGLSVAEPWALYRAAWPAGGAITTVGDMLRYAAFHMGDGRNADGEAIMSRESLRDMRAIHAPKAGTDDFIGLTWHLADVDSRRTVSHSGGTNGQISLLLMVPEDDFALAITTNADSGRELTRVVSRWILEHYLDMKEADPEPIRMAAGDLQQYAGTYSRPFMDLDVSIDGDRLMIRTRTKQSFMSDDVPPPDPPAAFAFQAEDRVTAEEGATEGQFIRTGDGSVGWLRIGGRIHVRQ